MSAFSSLLASSWSRKALRVLRKNAATGVALVPASIELLCGGPKLHNQVTGQVLRLGFPALHPPKPYKRGFIVAHDDSGIGAADESSPIPINRRIFHLRLPVGISI